MPDDFQALSPGPPPADEITPSTNGRFSEVNLRKPQGRHWLQIPYFAFLGFFFGGLVAGIAGNFVRPHAYLPFFFGEDGPIFDGLQYGFLLGVAVGVVRMCFAIQRERQEAER